jgi:FkbM family methyltransferase
MALRQDLFLICDLVRSILRRNGLLKRSAKSATYTTREGVVFKMRRDVWDSAILMETWWLHEYHRYLRDLGMNPVIVDIGAHIGDFSLLMAHQIPGARILAYEPEPENFALLEENIETNGFKAAIFPFRQAISDQSGEKMRIFRHPDNLGMHSQFPQDRLGAYDGTFIEAETVSLEDVFEQNAIDSCDLLKMDCEGGEYPILLNAPAHVLARIRRISLEYHKGGNIQEVRQRLERAGFRVKFDQAAPLVNAPLLYAWRE